MQNTETNTYGRHTQRDICCRTPLIEPQKKGPEDFGIALKLRRWLNQSCEEMALSAKPEGEKK